MNPLTADTNIMKTRTAHMLLIYVSVMITILVPTAFVVVGVNQQENCNDIERIKTQIRVTLERSGKSLPDIEYYRDRPAELRRALDQNAESLEAFRSNSCSFFGVSALIR